MEFLSGQTDAERGKDIIEMVVALAKKLNIMVIAEGVETKEQAEFLSRAGCENMQGYYYAKPMPISEYEQFFKEHLEEILTFYIKKEAKIYLIIIIPNIWICQLMFTKNTQKQPPSI